MNEPNDKIKALGLIMHGDQCMTAKPRTVNGADDYDEWENNRAKATGIIMAAMRKGKL